MPPLADLDVEDEGPAAAEEPLTCGVADTAVFLVTEAAEAVGLLTRAESDAVLEEAERGSNRGALNPADEPAGRGSVLCLLRAGEPLLLSTCDEAAEVVDTTVEREG